MRELTIWNILNEVYNCETSWKYSSIVADKLAITANFWMIPYNLEWHKFIMKRWGKNDFKTNHD